MYKKAISLSLVLALFLGIIFSYNTSITMATPKTLRLSQAKNLSLSNSATYRKIKNKIELKQISYKQAVKSLKLKKKNMSTFRWTPLLSFKFPEKADLVDESEFVYKPMKIQSEINTLKHQLSDAKLEAYEKAGLLYAEVYGYQEIVKFKENQLVLLEENLEKNKGRLLLGLATKSDVESIEKEISAITKALANDIKNFELTKKSLSDLINLDVTSGYIFENPYIDSQIPRKELDNIVEYTLENDHSYYEAKINTSMGLLLLDTNYDLMKSQYGSKMSYIVSYITQVKNGEKADGASFKKSYDQFLTAIDQPWQGKKRILFIKIPREWFKGAIDGVRYVEDEPYGLYEAALEYQELLEEQKSLAKEIDKQIRGDYETLISARKSYLDLMDTISTEEENLKKTLLLNSLGECTFEEYTEAKAQYEELQLEAIEALQLYTTLLFSYDKLTCGAASMYFNDEEITLNGAAGGDSYIINEETETAMYYINSIIEDYMFEFGIYLPEDFETEITHYELWADDYQIGERTSIDKKIRHMMITTEEVNKFCVRVYENDEFIDECKIDTQVYQGELDIVTGYVIDEVEQKVQIGTYSAKEIEGTAMSEISIKINAKEGVEYYILTNNEGKVVFSDELVEITNSFKYLSFIANSLEDVHIKCYDKDKNYLYDGIFSPSDYSIYKE